VIAGGLEEHATDARDSRHPASKGTLKLLVLLGYSPARYNSVTSTQMSTPTKMTDPMMTALRRRTADWFAASTTLRLQRSSACACLSASDAGGRAGAGAVVPGGCGELSGGVIP